MIPAGPLLDQLYDDVDASTPDRRAKVLRRLNLSYYDIARMISWAPMRRSMTLSLPGTAAGVRLPADLCGIDAVYAPASSSSEPTRVYQPRNAWGMSDPNDAVYRYAITSYGSTPLASGTGASVNKGETTVSGLPSSISGEYVTFGGRMGFYKLASDTALEVPFAEESVQQGDYTIRPPGTQTLQAYDQIGSYVAGSVTLDYWAYPTPIVDAASFVQLPQTDVLLLHATMRHIGIKNIDEQRADRYRREFEDALMRAKSLNPIYITPASPVTAYGGVAGWGAQIT